MEEEEINPQLEQGSPAALEGEESFSCTDTVDPAAVDAHRKWTLTQIREADVVLQQGMDFLFSNKVSEAEGIFRSRKGIDPVAAFGFGMVAFLRAVTSKTTEDTATAVDRLSFAYKFCNAIPPAQSLSQKAFGMWKKEPKITPAEFRAAVVKGQAELLRGTLELFAESKSATVRAALSLRRGYNIFDSLLKSKSLKEDAAAYDDNSKLGLKMGFGVMNVVISFLPPKALSVLNAMGYKSNRKEGLLNAQACYAVPCLHQHIASLFLLFFHGVLPSIANTMIAEHIPKALEIGTTVPSSCMHHWLVGRTTRIVDPANALESLHIALGGAESQPDFSQVRILCKYDLAWCYCLLLQFEKAIDLFAALQEESTWSKAYYAYAQACCHDALGNTDKAKILYATVGALLAQKQEKPIPLEVYCLRKAQLTLARGRNTPFPMVEFMSLQGLLVEIPEANAQSLLDKMEADSTAIPNLTPSDTMTATFLKACLLGRINKTGEALVLFGSIDGSSDKTLDPWIQPHSLFEHANLNLRSGNVDEGKKQLHAFNKKFGSKEYDFDVRLGWRVHLTWDHVHSS